MGDNRRSHSRHSADTSGISTGLVLGGTGLAAAAALAAFHPEAKNMIRKRLSSLHSVLKPKNPAEAGIVNGTRKVEHIFVFWHAVEKLHLFEKRCIYSMLKSNPTIPIKMIDVNSFVNKFPILVEKHRAHLSPQCVCDWLRLHALYQCGGVYMDASCVCLESVDSWPYKNHMDRLCGFSLDRYRWGRGGKKFPTFENSMLYAPPGDPFVKLWLLEYEQAFSEGFQEYRDRVVHEETQQGIAETDKIIQTDESHDVLNSFGTYMTAYVCFRKAYLKAWEEKIKLPFCMGPLPLQWAQDNEWDRNKYMPALFGSSIIGNPPVVKLWKGARADARVFMKHHNIDLMNNIHNSPVLSALSYEKDESELNANIRINAELKKGHSTSPSSDLCEGRLLSSITFIDNPPFEPEAG